MSKINRVGAGAALLLTAGAPTACSPAEQEDVEDNAAQAADATGEAAAVAADATGDAAGETREGAAAVEAEAEGRR